mmetsp:Transcript_20294/g.81068  ORF Transcript_20294/g.81068 Transcript_20294/m.81068 type:complete len:340 (+) Transcript_20294:251-1270(+)
MTLTNSHATTMHDREYARFSALFASLARAEAKVWADFNRWWLAAPIPLLVVRYEDLVEHRDRTLRRLARFLAGHTTRRDSPTDGDVHEETWDAGLRACAEIRDLAEAGPYAPRRKKQHAIGAALRRFEAHPEGPALAQDVADRAGRALLRDLGYDADRGFPRCDRPAPRALRLPVPDRWDPARHAVVDDDDDSMHSPSEEVTTTPSRALVVNAAEIAFRARDDASPYGRFMTTLRKSLTEPIFSDAGEPLNMHEVRLAREKRDAAAEALAGAEARCTGGRPEGSPPLVLRSEGPRRHRRRPPDGPKSTTEWRPPTKAEQLRLLAAQPVPPPPMPDDVVA